MTRTTRRGLLKGGLVAGAALGSRAGAMVVPAGLAIGDTALPTSRDFLMATGSRSIIDLAGERPRGWRALRTLDGPPRIEGLTRWSDWVAVRGLLLAQGYRVSSEQRIPGVSAGPALFRWTLSRRAVGDRAMG